ncbi:MAG: 2-dehydropantoate 2-reductase [Betaproteobacteria bacterium]|nr:2-dehydropantoate 2-reductase [Betaproteobacteria bacterium]
MKILVLGAGGTGGYFGGRLHQAGADVTFLVRERRAQQIASQGLIIESVKDRVELQVKTVQAADVKPEYDLVILSCKAYDLDSSVAAIAPAMRPDTRVVPLLNGISHLDKLDQRFGKARVLGGSCQIAATLTADGIVKSMIDAHTILWGARDPSQQKIANQLGEAFAKSVVDWKVSDNVMLDMWEKVAFLSTLAGMTCLMRGSVGDILATPDGQKLMQRHLDSCVEVARKEGYPPRDSVLERYQKVVNSAGSPLTASMMRDLENGGPVEADHIVGYMLTKAREHGIDDSMLTVAYTHLKAYEARRARMAAAAKPA